MMIADAVLLKIPLVAAGRGNTATFNRGGNDRLPLLNTRIADTDIPALAVRPLSHNGNSTADIDYGV